MHLILHICISNPNSNPTLIEQEEEDEEEDDDDNYDDDDPVKSRARHSKTQSSSQSNSQLPVKSCGPNTQGGWARMDWEV